VSIQAQIINLLLDLKEQRNLTYMFISHDLNVIRFISDEIAVMYLGQIVETAAKNVFFNNPYRRSLPRRRAAVSVRAAGKRSLAVSATSLLLKR